MDTTVNEANKELDRPRISTVLKVRLNETELDHSRISKGGGYEYEYLFFVTPMVEKLIIQGTTNYDSLRYGDWFSIFQGTKCVS